MTAGGARVWYFPDGYLPAKVSNGPMEAHEALMLFNASAQPAQVRLDTTQTAMAYYSNVGHAEA